MVSTPRNDLQQMGPITGDHPGIFTEAVNRLDALVNPSIIDRDLTAPPGGETDGDAYMPTATATGAWAGQEGNIAHYWGGGWFFTVPVDGFRCFVEDEHAVIAHDGTSWFTLEALVTVADDAAVSYTAPDTFGLISVASDDVDGVGIMWFETAGATTLKVAGAANTNVTTGVLAGTTGTDVKLTLSAHTDGKVYIENRLGASAEIRFRFLGMP
jgi:hypothetical protein